MTEPDELSSPGAGKRPQRRVRAGGLVVRKKARPQTQRPLFGTAERELRLEFACRRIHAWLCGKWSDGCTWHIWCKHQFHRATKRPPKKGGNWRPLTVSYIEKVFRVFRRRYADVYDFELIPWKRSRAWRITVRETAAGVAGGLSHADVGRRLRGYIASSCRQKGTAHVDRLFLERFARTSLLPLSMIEIAAGKLGKIAGVKLRKRGSGAGKKIVATLLQSSPRHSSLREKRTKNSEGSPQQDRAVPIRSESSQPVGRARRCARECKDGPFPGGGRVVIAWKLAAKAHLMAVKSMRTLHEDSPGVRWRYSHARNFAYRSLRRGFTEDDILEAYRSGCRRSHYDFVVAGEREPREPSATVSIARGLLDSDPRSDDARWRAFFAAPRRPRPAAVHVKAPAAADVFPEEQRAELRLFETWLQRRGILDYHQRPTAERNRIMTEYASGRAKTRL